MQVPEFIGMPDFMMGDGLGGEGGITSSYPTDMRDQILRTMPIAYITPMIATPSVGLELYTLKDGWGSYSGFMDVAAGVTFERPGKLRLILNGMSGMGENYSNSYSQSALLSGLQEVSSQGLQDLSQMSGGLDNRINDLAKNDKGAAGDMARMMLSGKEKAQEGLAKITNARAARQIMDVLTKPDRKIDFPQMWRSSSYGASYDLTVRLHNPRPANDILYENLIVGSLGAMMGMTLPVSDDGNLYRWPFLCTFEIPGLVKIEAAYVSSLSVIKGGEVNDLSWQQKWVRPNMIDVRMTISPVFNVMVMSKKAPISNQPTIRKELENMLAFTGSAKGGFSTTAVPADIPPEEQEAPRNIPTANANAASAISAAK